MSNLLDGINCPNDVKKLNIKELKALAKEIRQYIIDVVSVNGGHLASNLGIVELTLALDKVLDLPNDKVIYDVGHQCYTHKILSGRREQFKTLRQINGLSGFPKRDESEFDTFNMGHSGTSISVAMGLAKARDLKNENRKIVAVIGDGSISNGLAFEALNNVANQKTNLLVVLNDNEMSIDRNVGALSEQLSKIRVSRKYENFKSKVSMFLKNIPMFGKDVEKLFRNTKNAIKSVILKDMVFEHFGFKYVGPVDGNNLEDLVDFIGIASEIKGPVLLHIFTQKGKGFAEAETSPQLYHGFSPVLNENKEHNFTFNVGKKLSELARQNEGIVAITAAMSRGVGLSEFEKEFPERFIDVGINEEHAVTMAAGLACGGLKPYVCIYSTFLQRAYDQIFHDVCLQDMPVVFCIDRAGLVGRDGETHHGIYDISFFKNLPNIEIYSPATVAELRRILDYSVFAKHPIAIRYPNSDAVSFDMGYDYENYAFTKEWKFLKNNNSKNTILAVGSRMLEMARNAEIELAKKDILCNVVNCATIMPLDNKFLKKLQGHKVLTLEDGIKIGGFGSNVAFWLSQNDIMTKIECFGYQSPLSSQGSVKELQKYFAFTEKDIINYFVN